MSEINKSDKARDDSFEDLVIPESHRSLLTGLVKGLVVEQKAQSGPQEFDKGLTQIDLVRGKGRGLIILLHGPPGSGKTSTAETLAAYTRRPLYPITCGDLGTSPESVEEALVEHTESSKVGLYSATRRSGRVLESQRLEKHRAQCSSIR